MKLELNLNIRLYRYFDQITSNPYRLVLAMPIFLVISNLLIFHVLGGANATCSGQGLFSNEGLFEQFFLLVIIGPAFETIIFHFLLLELLLFMFQKAKYKYVFVILISSLIFAITHQLQIHFFIISFIGGIIFSWSYIIAKIKNMIPVVIVFLIHALANLGIFLINLPSRI